MDAKFKPEILNNGLQSHMFMAENCISLFHMQRELIEVEERK